MELNWFPGFSGEWEEKKLGEMSTFRRGSFPQPYGNPDWYDDLNGFPFVQVFDVGKNFLLKPRTKQKISQLATVKSVFVPKNTIILTIQGSIGRIAITQYDAYVDRTLLIFTDFDIPVDKVYFAHVVHLLFEVEKRSAPGGTIKTITKEVLSGFKFSIPLLSEQQKIASFLSSVDTKIEQLTNKKAKLEIYKKGMMQKLFNQEIRFKDDEGKEYPDWEEKKFEDVATFSKGKGISKLDISNDGGLECIRYGELYTTYGETISDVKSKTNIPADKLVMSVGNDVIIPASGETAIDIATASCVIRNGIALGGDLNIIRSKENGVFLSYYLNSVKKYDIARLAQGVSVMHLYSSQLKSLQLRIPSLPEQQNIADFLSSIDDKIEKVGEELENAKTFKKGLLQQMFV